MACDPKLKELFGDTLKGKDGDVPVEVALKDAKVIGIYFSAHWCPPCRGFTPTLAECFTKLTEEGNPFKIVFVSSDRDQKSFDDYYKDMPWLALPFEDREKKDTLSHTYGVRGIPTLILLDATGKTITTDGRAKITSDPSGFPWIEEQQQATK